MRVNSSVGRADVLYTSGPWFEPRFTHHYKIERYNNTHSSEGAFAETLHDETPRLEHVSINNFFNDVNKAAEEDGGKIKGSTSEYTPEKIISTMESFIRTGLKFTDDAPLLETITRAHGIRDRFIEVLDYHNALLEEMKKPNPDIFSQCNTLEEVKEVIFTLGMPIDTGERQYDYEELKNRIEGVDNGQLHIAYLTRTAGLRQAVIRIKGTSNEN